MQQLGDCVTPEGSIHNSKDVDSSLGGQDVRTRSLPRTVTTWSRRLLPACLLAGCATTPDTFRVLPIDSASGDLTPEVFSPESFTPSSNQVSVIFRLDDGGHGCQKSVEVGELSVRRVSLGLGAVAGSSALVFTLPKPAARDDGALTRALSAFWDSGASFRKCYGLDGAAAKEQLFRWVRLHRPLSPMALLDEAFGIPSSDVHNLRTVQLRAGMRLCATDVVNDSRPTGNWVAMGESCTRVVIGPNGGVVLDATLAQFNSLSSPAAAYGVIDKVASWGEIAAPNRDPLLMFVVYPQSLPGEWKNAPPEPVRQPLVVGVKIASDTDMKAIADLLRPPPSSQSDSAEERLTTLCQMTVAVCYKFGERGMISISVPIFLNGAPFDVPVGTKLADVDAMMRPDLSSPNTLVARTLGGAEDDPDAARLTSSMKGLRMYRSLDGVLHRVDLSKAGPKAGRMPLLPGDRLAW